MTGSAGRYEENAALLKALAHPLRLQIVQGLLLCGCRNVRCIEEKTGQSQSCISQHLSKLRSAGVVQAERSGNEVYYAVSAAQSPLAVLLNVGDRVTIDHAPQAEGEASSILTAYSLTIDGRSAPEGPLVSQESAGGDSAPSEVLPAEEPGAGEGSGWAEAPLLGAA